MVGRIIFSGGYFGVFARYFAEKACLGVVF
jgi:hypothetical protein